MKNNTAPPLPSPFHCLLQRISIAKQLPAPSSLAKAFLKGFWGGFWEKNPADAHLSRMRRAIYEAFAQIANEGAKRRTPFQHHQTVCFFNTTAFWGGGEKWHFEAASFFHTQKTAVAAVASGLLLERLQAQQITTLNLQSGKLGFLNPFKIRRLVRFFREKQVKSVIFNGPADLKLGAIAALLAGVPQVVYRRGIAVQAKPSLFNQFLFGVAVTHFMANSEETLRLLFERFDFPLEKINVQVIYNGIDLSPFEKIVSKKDSAPIKLGNLGRLVPQKGQDLLLEIGALLQKQGLDFQLYIGGTGPSEATLREQAVQLGIAERVIWMGFIEDVPAFMADIDIFLLTSKWEGFGFVLAEAMASGLPVLAFDVSSNPEILPHGKAGYLIPPFDTQAFAEKIRLFAQNEALRLQMGAQGRQFAQENFDRHRQLQKVGEMLGG